MIGGIADQLSAGVSCSCRHDEAWPRGGRQSLVDTLIGEAGWGESFSHGTGHGVGLEIHEDPRVTFASTATLAAGHVVTVEPGVYLPEQGGVRIEDTLVVTADGSRPLTHASKNWDLRSWPSPPTI